MKKRVGSTATIVQTTMACERALMCAALNAAWDAPARIARCHNFQTLNERRSRLIRLCGFERYCPSPSRQVKAEVVTCTRKEAHLQSLIENIARTKPGSMDFARELKRLYDEDWDFKRIARIACKSEHYRRTHRLARNDKSP